MNTSLEVRNAPIAPPTHAQHDRRIGRGLLGLFLGSLLLAGCDSLGSGKEENPVAPPEVESVTYTNKTFGPGRLDDAAGGSYALDVRITLAETVEPGDLARILLFADLEGGGLGWEISSSEDMEIVGNTVHLRNLLVTRPENGDAQFELTLEWQRGEASMYRFIHKGVYPPVIGSQAEWYDREELRLVLSAPYGGALPDSGQVYWLDDDAEIGQATFSAQNIEGAVLALRDVPSTATAYYLQTSQQIQGVATVAYSGTGQLPDRIPPNVAFIDGLDLPEDAQGFAGVWASGNTFVALSADRTSLQTSLHVIDALGRTLRASYPLNGQVTAVTVADGFAYLGYQTGLVQEIALDSGEQRALATLDAYPEGMVRIGGWLLASAEVGYNEQVFSINVNSGEVTSSNGFRYYAPHHFAYSPALKRGFADKGGISPQDLMAFNFNEATGTISDVRESRYHGDYPIRGPFFLTPDQTEIVTSAGTAFTTTPPGDLEFAGRFAYATHSLLFYPTNDRAYAFRSPYHYGQVESLLDVYAMGSREHLRAVSLVGVPSHLIQANAQLFVLSVTGEQFKRAAVTVLDVSEVEPGKTRALRVIEPSVSR